MAKRTVELIESVKENVPYKGKMYCIINGQYWSQQVPSPSDTHVILEEVAGTGDHEGQTFTNVAGFKRDTRMTIADKINTLTQHDAQYAVGIATLLR